MPGIDYLYLLLITHTFNIALAYYRPLPNNIIVQVHVITPAPPKIYHVTPQGFNYLHAKNY